MFRNESPEPTEDPLNVNRKPIKPEVILPARDSDPAHFIQTDPDLLKMDPPKKAIEFISLKMINNRSDNIISKKGRYVVKTVL